jgi:hypothetical protein
MESAPIGRSKCIVNICSSLEKKSNRKGKPKLDPYNNESKGKGKDIVHPVTGHEGSEVE